MKVWEHAAIGLASGALLYLTRLELPPEVLCIFAGIVIGAALPDIDGNWPKEYQHNPVLFWASYVNHLLVYPFVMLIYRTRELDRRSLSTFPAIGTIAVLIFGVYWIVSQLITMPFPIEPVILGILVGGTFTIAGHLGTGGGASPLFPVVKWWVHGTVEPRAPGEVRPKALVVVPLTVWGVALLGGSELATIETPYLPVNQWALVAIWLGYFIAAETIPVRELPGRIRHGIGQLSPFSYPFESEIERYIFEALNAARQEHGLTTSLEFLKEILDVARKVLEAERELDPREERDRAKEALTELFNEVKSKGTPVIVERIVTDIDEIVKRVRFPDWQLTSQGERLVQKELRRTLLRYKLHTDQELFDRAYGYIRQYYCRDTKGSCQVVQNMMDAVSEGMRPANGGGARSWERC